MSNISIILFIENLIQLYILTTNAVLLGLPDVPDSPKLYTDVQLKLSFNLIFNIFGTLMSQKSVSW